MKHKAQNFASWMFSEYAFKIERKKGNDFFDHSTTLIVTSAGQRERLQQAKKLLPGYNQMRLGFRQYSLSIQTLACVSITLLELQHLL